MKNVNIASKHPKFITLLSNLVLAIVITVVSLCVVKIETNETLETVAKFNGTIYAGDQNSNKVTLMINVYWGNEHVESMLETFSEFDMHTTFFVGGSWVNENPSLAQKIKDMGHEIASHATTHADLGKLDYSGNHKEIQTCHDIVSKTLGVEMNLLAPPSGSYNKNTVTAAENLGYRTIMWTRDTVDWRDRDTNVIYSRAVNNMQGGDLVLMHPTKETAEALPKILEFIQKNGFVLATVTDNIGQNI
ncbi:MAG: polysaccharide deacetylase family protein [Clostridia bacterium]|nr:polysaccharide deacetylase family protein [Clostridia bacterium]